MLQTMGRLTLLVALVLVLMAGTSAASGDGFMQQAGAREAAAPPTWRSADDFVYQLQNVDLAAMGQTRFDLAIIDYSRDGSDEQRYTAAQIARLKNSPGGRKLVLAYMSIGEAEDYRWYWRRSWDANRDGRPDRGAPSWLGPSNPEWRGNYKVRYWDPSWQAIVRGYVDRLLAAGYDGMYLDIIDAYEYWEPGGPGRPARATARRDMVDFVKNITAHARKKDPDFGVFPQNGEGLAVYPDYLRTVNGIGKEDFLYDGNRRQPAEETAYSARYLDRFKAAGKPVLVTDYTTRRATTDDFYRKAEAKGYVPYATRRDLHVLTINPGHAPD